MLDPLFPLEEKSSQPEIELYLGNHHHDRFSSNEIVIAKIEKLLEEESQKDKPRPVYAYLELEGFGQAKSEMFTKLLDESNHTITQAFAIAFCSDAGEYWQLQAKQNIEYVISQLKNQPVNTFKFNQLESLQKLRNRYKDKNETPVLQIAIEPTQKEFAQERARLPKLVEAFVDRGEFDEGIKLFKELLEAEAKAISYREPEIAKHIKQIFEQNPRAIIMRYGTGHDTLQKVMLNENIESKLIYIDTPDVDGVSHPFIFSKSQELVKNLVKDINTQITEIEWLQAMILDRLIDLCNPSSHKPEGQIYLKEQTQRVGLLSSLELIQLFQHRVKEKGLADAFEEIENILNNREN
jgi:hypothetical protein